jgi:hypothetical protein
LVKGATGRAVHHASAPKAPAAGVLAGLSPAFGKAASKSKVTGIAKSASRSSGGAR